MENIAKALIAFQGDIVSVEKTATNPFFKNSYVPLDELRKQTQPLLTRHKLGVIQLPSQTTEGKPALTTIIVHESGESIEATTELLLAKNDPQGQGSAITYMRRYAYMGALGLVGDEDDDAESLTIKATRKANTDTTKTGGEQEELARAKAAINAQLIEQNYITVDARKAFIKLTLGKETIDDINDANEVADALDNEKTDE